MFLHAFLQASFLNAQLQEPDWAEWYQQQDRLPDQSPAPTEVPTPSPSPPRADELAVPEMAPPPRMIAWPHMLR